MCEIKSKVLLNFLSGCIPMTFENCHLAEFKSKTYSIQRSIITACPFRFSDLPPPLLVVTVIGALLYIAN